MNRRVLVTGAYGFIGRHVAKCFSNYGYHVTGIGHGNWCGDEQEAYGVDRWCSDSVSFESLSTRLFGETFDVIVHCAGSGSVFFSMSHPHDDFVSSVSTTAATLEYARLHAPQAKFIYLSSAAVYGAVEALPISESEPLKPLSPYGVHKLLCEELCRSYSNNFNLTVTVVRLFSIYGDGLKKQLLWDACNKIVAGDYSFSGTGAEVRDWLHVTDVAELIVRLSNVSSDNFVFNGGAGVGVSVKDILVKLFQANTVQGEPYFSGLQRAGDPPGFQADTALALATGWTPKVNLEQGVRNYADWFKSVLAASHKG
ncbi:putative nucleoside-diphosphate-sugar epimerase protein [Pseudomonas sp. 8AS]|uniref:NAD-dependent epimerase/dehydratase family protein n=1 Tax=Pseudomonas sp. 8AS TaxID=2653163 RepID=UPI0012F02FE7|nr:NAD(P)-dependent oxidoreductase [Pseudomonas sp. 8AS]VXB83340.1 putative nucleoside-diphosphate-sugar epimerase protein [Pseudomonas sp. 8AS]